MRKVTHSKKAGIANNATDLDSLSDAELRECLMQTLGAALKRPVVIEDLPFSALIQIGKIITTGEALKPEDVDA